MNDDFHALRRHIKQPARFNDFNPLFISVAESMVMRWPIFHVGWFSGLLNRDLSKSDLGVFRNGPPLR